MKDVIVSRFLSLAGERILHMRPVMPQIALGAGRGIQRQHVGLKSGRNPFVFPAMLLMAVQVSLASPVAAQESAADSGMMQRMEALIREQQQQMQRQQQQMAEQQKQLDQLRQQLDQLKTTTTESLSAAKDAERVAQAAEKTAQSTANIEDTLIHSGAGDPRDVGPGGLRPRRWLRQAAANGSSCPFQDMSTV